MCERKGKDGSRRAMSSMWQKMRDVNQRQLETIEGVDVRSAINGVLWEQRARAGGRKMGSKSAPRWKPGTGPNAANDFPLKASHTTRKCDRSLSRLAAWPQPVVVEPTQEGWAAVHLALSALLN